MQQANVLKPFFYIYSIIFTAANGNAIANAGIGTNSVQIESGANFVAQQIIGVSFNAAVLVANPFALLQITDLSSNLPLFDRPLPFSMVTGNAQLPYILPTPRTFRANGGIQAQITNNDGGTRDFTLILAGQKVPVSGI